MRCIEVACVRFGACVQAPRRPAKCDIRNSFMAGITYMLPSPQSQSALRAVFGGWSLGSFLLARTAPPADVIGSRIFLAGATLYPRPNLNPGVPTVLHGSQYPGDKAFNKAAFSAAAAGQQGNFARLRRVPGRCSNSARVRNH